MSTRKETEMKRPGMSRDRRHQQENLTVDELFETGMNEIAGITELSQQELIQLDRNAINSDAEFGFSINDPDVEVDNTETDFGRSKQDEAELAIETTEWEERLNAEYWEGLDEEYIDELYPMDDESDILSAINSIDA